MSEKRFEEFNSRMNSRRLEKAVKYACSVNRSGDADSQRDSLIIVMASHLVTIYLHILHLIRRKDFHSLSLRDRDVVAAANCCNVAHPRRVEALSRSSRRARPRRARYRRTGASILGPVKIIPSRKAAAIYRERPAFTSQRKAIARETRA